MKRASSPTHGRLKNAGRWVLAFLVMVIAELALFYMPDIPPRVAIMMVILALVRAFKFTECYPERARARSMV